MLNVFSAMVTIQPSTKSYKIEPSHPYKKKKQGGKNQKVLTQTPVRLDISYAYILKSQHNQYETATAQTHKQIPYQQQPQPPTSDIQELKVMMKGLMEQMSTMLSLLTTRVSKTA